MRLDPLFLILVIDAVSASSIPTLATQTSSISSSHIANTVAKHPDLRLRATTTAVTPLQTALCGWLGGDPGQPWTCAVDGQCVIATAKSTNAVGCCVSGKCATFRTSCVPATAQCNSACSANKANLICGNDQPLCATFTYPGNYTELRCTNSAPPTLQVAFTFSGFTTPLPLPRVLSTMTSCDSTGRCMPDLTIQTQTPTSSKSSISSSKTGTKTSSSAGPTSTSATADSGSSSNTGAIIGGVVGGVGVVALIGGGLFLYYWRKKRAQRNQQSTAIGGAAGSPYYSPQPGSVMPDRGSYYPNDGGVLAGAPVYGAAMKAELPTQGHEHVVPPPMEQNKSIQPQTVDVPAQRETWEMDGVVRQDTPLMELEAHEMQNR